MKNIFLTRVAVTATLVLVAFQTKAQNTEDILGENSFEIFKEFTNYGLSLSPRMQFKATTNRTIGTTNFIDYKNSFTYGLGLFYVVRPAHQFSYRVGLNFNKINEYKYGFSNSFENRPFESASSWVYAVSVPLEVEYKMPLTKKMFFSLRGGFDVTFLKDDSALASANNQFTLAYATPNTSIYPNLRLSPGVYFTLGKVLLQTSIVYQKMIPNFVDGTYKIENIQNHPNSEGTYKMSGDYIGLDLNFQFKKRNKNN